MPKAANINHYRVMLASHAFAGVMDTQASDRMYDCLPMYHTVGGLGGDRLGAAERRLGGDPREILRPRILGRRGAPRVHAVPVHRRAVPLSGALAAEPEREPAQAPHGLRQWASPRPLGRVQEPLPHPAHPGVLRRHRRQREHLQLRGPPRRGRPRAVVRRASLSDRGGALRRRQAGAGAQRRGLLRALRAERAGRGDRPHRQRRLQARQPLRGLRRLGAEREQGAARRVQEGRRLVPHRRPDAQGRPRLFLFRRPGRRHLPLEGRERLHLRGRRGAQHLPRRRRRQRLRRHRGRPRRPRRDGGDRLRGPVRSWRAARPSRQEPAGLRPAAVPSHPPSPRRHRHLQADQDGSGAPGLQSGRHRRADLLQRSAERMRSCRSTPRSTAASRAARSGCDRRYAARSSPRPRKGRASRCIR